MGCAASTGIAHRKSSGTKKQHSSNSGTTHRDAREHPKQSLWQQFTQQQHSDTSDCRATVFELEAANTATRRSSRALQANLVRDEFRRSVYDVYDVDPAQTLGEGRCAQSATVSSSYLSFRLVRVSVLALLTYGCVSLQIWTSGRGHAQADRSEVCSQNDRHRGSSVQFCTCRVPTRDIDPQSSRSPQHCQTPGSE
jgi:hypothetical protein